MCLRHNCIMKMWVIRCTVQCIVPLSPSAINLNERDPINGALRCMVFVLPSILLRIGFLVELLLNPIEGILLGRKLCSYGKIRI